jgi:hypothetical protein
MEPKVPGPTPADKGNGGEPHGGGPGLQPVTPTTTRFPDWVRPFLKWVGATITLTAIAGLLLFFVLKPSLDGLVSDINRKHGQVGELNNQIKVLSDRVAQLTKQVDGMDADKVEAVLRAVQNYKQSADVIRALERVDPDLDRQIDEYFKLASLLDLMCQNNLDHYKKTGVTGALLENAQAYVVTAQRLRQDATALREQRMKQIQKTQP